jgi:ElaB/YqjD/DUF883 family membrane-anchored ribosome-binding protein
MSLFRRRSRIARNEIDALRAEIASLASSLRSMTPRTASSSGWWPSSGGSSTSSWWPASGGSSASSWPTNLWPFGHRESWSDQAYNRLGDARDAAHHGADAMSRQVDWALTSASQQLRERPLTAVVALLGIGVALGLAARSVSSD